MNLTFGRRINEAVLFQINCHPKAVFFVCTIHRGNYLYVHCPCHNPNYMTQDIIQIPMQTNQPNTDTHVNTHLYELLDNGALQTGTG